MKVTIPILIVVLALLYLAPAWAQDPAPCKAPGDPRQEPTPASRDQLYRPIDRSQVMQVFPPDGDPEADKQPDGSRWAFKGTLLPGVASRLFRPLSFSSSLVDQLDQIFDGTVDPETGQPNSLPNTAEDLSKTEVTVTPGSLFRSTAELGEAYGVVLGKQTSGFVDATSDPLRATPSGDKLKELAWADGQGLWKRLLFGIEMTIGVSERSPFSGTAQLPPEILSQDDDEFVYSISWDFNSLVSFPEEVKEAYDVLKQHTQLDPGNKAGLDVLVNERCKRFNPVKCLREVSGVGVRGRWLAGILPELTYKTVDQFDFIQAAGTSFPLNEDSIETLTLTWDLGSSLDSASHRRAAMHALAVHRELAARDDRRNLQPQIASTSFRLPKGFPLTVQLVAKYRDESESPTARTPDSVEWELTRARRIGGPNTTEKIKVSKTGALSTLDAPAGTYELRLCLVDDVNNYSRREQLLRFTID